jgi:long-subunit fatty acid transport protein
VDVSPTLSLGAAITLLDGDYNYDWDLVTTDPNDLLAVDSIYTHDTQAVDFDGVSLQLGGLLRINRSLRAGMTIHSPVTYDLFGEALERDLYVFDGGGSDRETGSYLFQNEISTPWEFGLGLAWSVPTLLLAGDVRYVDWSQMKVNDESLPEYDERLSWSLGGEYVLPRIGMKLRAGYASDPIAFNVPDIIEDRNLYSLGAGFLVGQVMTMDVAWVKSSWETFQRDLPQQVDGQITEQIEVERIFLNLAYRF